MVGNWGAGPLGAGVGLGVGTTPPVMGGGTATPDWVGAAVGPGLPLALGRGLALVDGFGVVDGFAVGDGLLAGTTTEPLAGGDSPRIVSNVEE